MQNNIFYNAAPIIHDKQTFLIRPHIHRLFKKLIQKPVTIIVAGTGYGKTQAVYGFLSEYAAITFWLQFSTYDNLVTRFWENVINVISLYNKVLALKLKSLGFPETTDSFDKFFAMLCVELKQGQKYVIVFDELHLVNEKNILQFIERLIYIQIPKVSIILISRNEPNINIVGLLSKGLLSRINEDVLRFSESDMMDYFKLQDIQLSSKTLAAIYKYTEGLIFPIHLVGLSQKSGLPNEEYALSAAKENISRLIENEIFSVMSKELRDFLIKLSLFDNLPLKLICELCSDNPDLMRELSKISSFVRYDSFIDTYRIHHLFLNFLSEKQGEIKKRVKRKIYIKAARWYDKNGHKIDAITFYEKVKKYDEIIKIILSLLSLAPPETVDFLLKVLERASKEMIHNKIIPELLHTRFFMEIFRFKEAKAELLALKAKYEAMPPTKENSAALCGIYVNLGIVCLYSGTNELEHFFKKAYDTGSKIIKTDYELIVFNYACRVFCPAAGVFDRYLEVLANAAPYMIELMHGFGCGYVELARAEFAFFQKDFKNAENHAKQALYKAQQKQQHSIGYMATFYLIRINMSVGNYTEVQSLIGQLKLQTEINNYSYSHTMFDIITGWYYASIGQVNKVAHRIRDFSDYRNEVLHKHSLDRLVCALCYLSEKKYHEVLALLENYEADYDFKDLLFGHITVKVLIAVCLYHIHEQEKALTTLEAAYNFAAPNRLDMLFIEKGNHIRALIKAAIRSKECAIPKKWLETIYTKTSTYAKSISHIIFEDKLLSSSEDDIRADFTNKELEILKDLCYGLSREEMAVNRNISINTVNSKLQTIYSKLGATNVLDAVRIATLMKLVE